MKQVLIDMIQIYKPNGIDWMNVGLTKKNPYTFHHIKEVRNGGLYKMENGAILTINAHEYLNYLDRYLKDYYKELNNLFLYLNRTTNPPTDDYFKEINKVLIKSRRFLGE